LVQRQFVELEQHVHFELGKFIMAEAQVEFVEAQRFAVDFIAISAAVAIRAESNEVFVFVRLALGPRDDVMDFNLNVPTGRDGTSVPRLD
jgi:hypothetical protein